MPVWECVLQHAEHWRTKVPLQFLSLGGFIWVSRPVQAALSFPYIHSFKFGVTIKVIYHTSVLKNISSGAKTIKLISLEEDSVQQLRWYEKCDFFYLL